MANFGQKVRRRIEGHGTRVLAGAEDGGVENSL
jgi:hypothetical protein